MAKLLSLTIAALVGLTAPAALANPPSPYAGEQNRPIKALSAEDKADLLAGRGMGMAKAGELNSYPGPSHVLALRTELALDPQQIAATQALFDTMQSQARALGAEIVLLEEHLDCAFAQGHADEAMVGRLVASIAELQGKLRAVHLQAHVAMKRLLKPQQVAAYDRLRGYAATDGAPAPGSPAHATMGGHKH